MLEQDQKRYDALRLQLPVNINQLHRIAEVQAVLACEAGELAAELKAAAKRARGALAEAESTADREVRKNPETFGLAKATEASVRSAVVAHPDVCDARHESEDADEDADRAAALANAYEHRRSMISIEARLYVANYWGSPEVQENEMRQNRDETSAKRERRINESRQKQRRKTKQPPPPGRD